MKINILILLLFSFTISYGQEKVSKPPVVIQNLFDSDAVSWFKNKGNAVINGNAKFKSIKGDLRFGSQFRIELSPVCLYTSERLKHIYNNNTSGFVFIEDGIPTFTPDPKEYHDTLKTICDDNGNFSFTELPNGEYYVIAFMLWDKTGGGLMQKVTITNQETKTITMNNF